MKFIFCIECHDSVFLSWELRQCACEQSWGHYLADGDACLIGGPSRLYYVDGGIFQRGSAQAGLYDERNGKVTRAPRKPPKTPQLLVKVRHDGAVQSERSHVTADIFVGKQSGSLGRAGTLTTSQEEWALLAPMLRIGAHHTFGRIHLDVEEHHG